VIGGNQALNSEQLVSTTGINLRSTLNHKFNHYDRRTFNHYDRRTPSLK
jgi:hypothetical protein